MRHNPLSRLSLFARNHILANLYYRRSAYAFILTNHVTSKAQDPVAALPPDWSFRVLSPEEILNFTSTIHGPLDKVQPRLSAGDACYGFFMGKDAVNINWVHTGPCFVKGLGYYHAASPLHAYIYNIYTLPEVRGQGIYSKALRLLSALLFENGIQHILQLVKTNNGIVINTLPKLGYTQAQSVYHKRFLGLRHTKIIDMKQQNVSNRYYVRSPKNVYVI